MSYFYFINYDCQLFFVRPQLTTSNQISFEFSLSFLKFFPIDLKKPLTVLNRESRWVQRTVSNYKP